MRALVIGEDALGHVGFLDSLQDRAAARPDLELDVVRLPFPPGPVARRLPGLRSNWSLRASALAVSRTRGRWRRADAALVHTQTAALALGPLMGRTPTWISIDATPANIDELGAAYGHAVASSRAEQVKRWVVRRTLARAEGLIAWSEWVRRSLIEDYGIAPERVHVVPAGVPLPTPLPDRAGRQGVRLLFVGGDFARKGGPALIEAFAQLRGAGLALDVVTKSKVESAPGVRVHSGLTPRSPELNALYRAADIAVLPTLGDASPFAVLEAMGWGLPVVTTPVGAIAETVVPGTTGTLVPPGDVPALVAALQQLVDDADLRVRTGAAARERAELMFDEQRNIDRVLEFVQRSVHPAGAGPAAVTG